MPSCCTGTATNSELLKRKKLLLETTLSIRLRQPDVSEARTRRLTGQQQLSEVNIGQFDADVNQLELEGALWDGSETISAAESLRRQRESVCVRRDNVARIGAEGCASVKKANLCERRWLRLLRTKNRAISRTARAMFA